MGDGISGARQNAEGRYSYVTKPEPWGAQVGD